VRWRPCKAASLIHAAQRRGWSHGGELPSLVMWPGRCSTGRCPTPAL
jgi:hypothetical protein